MITKRIAAAQKAVEAQNFAARKHVLEYDDVMNKQRQAVYGMRRKLLEGQDQKERIIEIVRGIVGAFIDARCPEGAQTAHVGSGRIADRCVDSVRREDRHRDLRGTGAATRSRRRSTISASRSTKRRKRPGPTAPTILRETERMIMLNVIDNQWKDHLLSMDHLKEGIGLRGYGQKDPLVEYKKESFTMFQDMMDRIEDETIRFLFFMQPYEGHRPEMPYPELLEEEDDEETPGSPDGNGVNGTTADQKAAQNTFQDFTRNIQRKKEKELADLQFVGGDGSSTTKQPVIAGAKVGRNDPCPCGSGKKYKKCCGVSA